MAIHIGRREFNITLGGAAAAWPLAVRAQQPIGTIRHVGVLLPGLPESTFGKATRDRLRELGYIEGRNIIFERGKAGAAYLSCCRTRWLET